jgi:cytochrome c
VFDYIRRAMPYNAPRSFSDSEVYALTAYILSSKGSTLALLAGADDYMIAC